MGSGNHLFDPNSNPQTAHHWQRRDFVKGVAALAGAAGLCAYDMRSAAAEPPPETTKLTLFATPVVTCIAPHYVAEELLYMEGFTDVRYVNFPKDTQVWPPEQEKALTFKTESEA